MGGTTSGLCLASDVPSAHDTLFVMVRDADIDVPPMFISLAHFEAA